MKFILSLILALGLVFSSISYGSTVRLNVPYEFYDSQAWNRVSNYIITSKHKVYVLNWRGIGGYTHLSIKFIRAITKAQNQGKTIVFNIIGFSASAHAFPICYGNKVIKKGKTLMFHNGTTPNKIIAPYMNQCMRVGLISKQQVQQVYNNKDVYIRY